MYERGFTRRNKKLGPANISGGWPLRAPSDESRLDPFSAALRSVSCLVQVQKNKKTERNSPVGVDTLEQKPYMRDQQNGAITAFFS